MNRIMRPDRETISRARRLRRKHTPAEWILWRHLANRRADGSKFRRQHPVGAYIVDFASLDQGLVVEVDGGEHARGARLEADEQRTAWLERHGFTVLRFWNSEVTGNIEGVLHHITAALRETESPSPQSSPSRERSRGPRLEITLGIESADA